MRNPLIYGLDKTVCLVLKKIKIAVGLAMFVSIIVFAILTNNNNFDVKIAFNYPKTTHYANNCLKTNYCWHRVQVNSGIAFWSDWQFYIIRLCISCTCACESLQFETYRVSIFICILTICIFYCFLIRRCCCYGNLLWKVNELSMFVKLAGNFLCSFFTIIITEKKKKKHNNDHCGMKCP